MRIRLAIASVALLSLVQACGGDDSPDPEADRAAAEEAIADFVAWAEEEGFIVDPESDPEAEDDDLEFQSEECRRLDEVLGGGDLPGQTVDLESDDHTKGALEVDGFVQEVTASVGAVEDDETLDEPFELLGSDELPGCLAEAVEASFASDPETAGIELTNVQVDEPQDGDIGDESLSFSLTMTVAAGGQELPVAMEFGAARSGRFAVSTFASVIGEGSSEVDVDEVLEILVDGLDS